MSAGKRAQGALLFRLAGSHAHWAPSQPVAGPALVGPYSDDATRTVLDALVPENCVVFDVRSSHDDSELVSRERWHGASYDEASLDDSDVKRWSEKMAATDSSLKLPLPNKFAAKASPLLPAGKGVVRLANTPEATTLWKRSDYARAPDSVPRVPKLSLIHI